MDFSNRISDLNIPIDFKKISLALSIATQKGSKIVENPARTRMPTHINRDIELLTYAEARAALNAVNPELCQEIDALGVDHHYPLLKMRYLYGDLLLNKGKFYVPDGKGGLVFRYSSECNNKVRELLEYAVSMPMGVALNRGLEIFYDHEDRSIPSTLGRPGYPFALTGVLEPETLADPINFWSISAGARSVQMVPRISEQYEHKRLCRELNIHILPPKTTNEQFAVFRTIAQAQTENPWTMEILIFTGAWFANRTAAPWRLFREYLFSRLWRNYGASRTTQEPYNIIISDVTKNLKPSPDLISTLQYWVFMAQSQRLGHYFATDDTLLPTAWLQKVYTDYYRLHNNQRPDILCPAYLRDNGSVFYSLACPNRGDLLRANNSSLTQYETLDYSLRMVEVLNTYLQKDTEELLRKLHAIRKVHIQGIHPKGGDSGRIINIETFAQQILSRELGELAPQSRFFCGAIQMLEKTPTSSR